MNLHARGVGKSTGVLTTITEPEEVGSIHSLAHDQASAAAAPRFLDFHDNDRQHHVGNRQTPPAGGRQRIKKYQLA